MKTVIRTLSLMALAAVLVTGCTRDNTKKVYPKGPIKSGGTGGNPSNSGGTGNRPSAPTAEGTSSGGGGFKQESGDYLLKRGSQELSKMIRLADPVIFKNFPKNMSQKDFADLIANVRSEPNRTAHRYGKELLFDYRKDSKGKYYLVATKGFFDLAAASPVLTLSNSKLAPHIVHLQVRLLHEAAHILGIGNTEATDPLARNFAVTLMTKLSVDGIFCEVDVAATSKEWKSRNDIEEMLVYVANRKDMDRTLKPKHDQSENGSENEKPEEVDPLQGMKFVWAIQRTTGKGVFYSPINEIGEKALGDYDQIREFEKEFGLQTTTDFKPYLRLADLKQTFKSIESMEDWQMIRDELLENEPAEDFETLSVLPTLEFRDREYQLFPYVGIHEDARDLSIHDWKEAKANSDGTLEFNAELNDAQYNDDVKINKIRSMIKIEPFGSKREANGLFSFSYQGVSQYEDVLENTDDQENADDQEEKNAGKIKLANDVSGSFPIRCIRTNSLAMQSPSRYTAEYLDGLKEVFGSKDWRDPNNAEYRVLLDEISSK